MDRCKDGDRVQLRSSVIKSILRRFLLDGICHSHCFRGFAMFSTQAVGGKIVLEKVTQQEAESSQAEPGRDRGVTPTK